MSRNKDFVSISAEEIKGLVEKAVRDLVREKVENDLKFKMSRDEDDEDEDDEDGRAHRDMTCIAPDCEKRSKGPRFRYLCSKHLDAPIKKVKKWQEMRRNS